MDRKSLRDFINESIQEDYGGALVNAGTGMVKSYISSKIADKANRAIFGDDEKIKKNRLPEPDEIEEAVPAVIAKYSPALLKHGRDIAMGVGTGMVQHMMRRQLQKLQEPEEEEEIR